MEKIKEEQELLKLSYEESVRQKEERKNNKRKLIKYNKNLLKEKGIDQTDENIFISATCGETSKGT